MLPAFSLLPGLASARKLLDILNRLRGITAPIDSPSGLRAALTVLLELLSLVGVEAAFVAKLQKVLDDAAVFNVVLALFQYAYGHLAQERESGDGGVRINATTVNVEALADWLPFVLQLMNLLYGFGVKR